MHSIPLAMSWEFVSQRRRQLLLGLLGGNVLPLILLTALRLDGQIDISDPAYVSLQFYLVQVGGVVFGAVALTLISNLRRLYTLPAPTSTLVAWLMLPVMALIVIQSALSTSLLNLLYGIDWPVWPPAVSTAIFLLAIQAAVWFSGESLFLPFFLVLATIPCLWFKSRYGPLFGVPNHYWRFVTLGDAATMFAFAAVSYAVATIGVARDRRGDGLGNRKIPDWIEDYLRSPLYVTNVGKRPFRSRLEAQFWSVLRTKGFIYPTVVAIGLTIGFAIWGLFSRDSRSLVEALVAAGAVTPIVGIVVAINLGNTGNSDMNTVMSQFLATQPISNRELSSTILRVTALSVAAGWVLWAVTLGAVLITFITFGGIVDPWYSIQLAWWYLPLTLLASWTLASVLASVALTGHNRPFVEIACTFIAVVIVAMLFSKLLNPEDRARLASSLLAGTGGALFICSLWITIVARRRLVISNGTVAVSGCIWILISAVVVSECWKLEALNPSTTIFQGVAIFLTGVASLVMLPMAAAPLAIAWNRHR